VKILITLTTAFLFLLPVTAMAIEEPEFEVIEQHDDYEIRRYDPYLVAEVTVGGAFKDSGSTAFRILADYIFGGNTSGTKMEMTAPVESQALESGTRMEMTAPVLSTQDNEKDDRYRYAFVIERRYDLESVPKPLDERVELRVVDPTTVAVLRYSGTWSQSNWEKNRDKLMLALQRDGLVTVGEPYLARYDAPFMPWFMRRNEVIIEIQT
jgi:hypothetical protein